MARRARHSGGTPATDVLAAAGVEHTRVEYTHHDEATDFGAEAARETGIDPAHLFKTLVVADPQRHLAVGVVPVSGRLDLKAIAAAWGVKKAEMADPAVVQRTTGYVLGGVSPLGMRTPLPTFLDASARDLGTLYVSGGKRGLQIGLAPADLARLTEGRFAPIAR